MNTTRHNQTRKTERIKAFVGFVVMNGHNQIAPDKPRFHLITRRSEVQVLPPQPTSSTEKDIGAKNPRAATVLGFFRAFFQGGIQKISFPKNGLWGGLELPTQAFGGQILRTFSQGLPLFSFPYLLNVCVLEVAHKKYPKFSQNYPTLLKKFQNQADFA